MKHELHMLLGCLLPFLAIFILPLFGVGDGVSLLVFIVLMFACHILMVGRHEHSPDSGENGTEGERP